MNREAIRKFNQDYYYWFIASWVLTIPWLVYVTDVPHKGIVDAVCSINLLFVILLHVLFWRPVKMPDTFFSKKITRFKLLWGFHMAASGFSLTMFYMFSIVYYLFIYGSRSSLDTGLEGAVLFPLACMGVEFLYLWCLPQLFIRREAH